MQTKTRRWQRERRENAAKKMAIHHVVDWTAPLAGPTYLATSTTAWSGEAVRAACELRGLNPRWLFSSHEPKSHHLAYHAHSISREGC